VSDVSLFLVVLWLLYFLEGLWWVPREAVSFSRSLLGASASATPILLRRDSQSGAVFPSHVVANGERFLSCGWPFVVSPNGIGSRLDDFGTQQIRFEETNALSVSGTRLLHRGRTFVRTVSPEAARRLLRWLRELSVDKPPRRAEKIVEAIDKALDHRTARRRVRKMRLLVRRSRWLPVALFINLGIFAPGAIIIFGAGIWPVPAAVHVVLSAVAVVVFYRTDRILYPGHREVRFSQVLTMILFAPAAARYAEMLSRDLLNDLHPMAVAAVIDRETLPQLARQAVCDSRRLLPEETEPAAWFRRRCEERMLLAFERYGIDPEALEEAPQREAGAAAYCPRCHAQYRSGIDDCVDCEGMTLVVHSAG
jgi:hypothetical protein